MLKIKIINFFISVTLRRDFKHIYRHYHYRDDFFIYNQQL